jgi:hypothetical protein
MPIARAAFPHANRSIAPHRGASKQPEANHLAALRLHGQSRIVGMTQSGAGDPGDLPEEKLLRRDWMLLPLLGLMMLGLRAVSSELIAPRFFGE